MWDWPLREFNYLVVITGTATDDADSRINKTQI